jgi:hypothetical protein
MPGEDESVILEFRSIPVAVCKKPYVLDIFKTPEYWVHAKENETRNIYRIFSEWINSNKMSIDLYLNKGIKSEPEKMAHLDDIDMSDLDCDITKKMEREAEKVYTAARKFAEKKAGELGVQFNDRTQRGQSKHL